jgi:Domain of unknown function (DUF6398)/Calcium binding
MFAPKSESVPAAIRDTYAVITGLTDAFCREHLTDEYATLCRQLTAALARKRPSPLVRGKPEIWACAVVYALGTVNFLFDKSQTPYMRADELCQHFGVSQSSGANKAKVIRDLFDMGQMDPNWCLPGQLDHNPLAWLIQVNGLMVDARYAPPEVQAEAYRRRLIPYIPAQSQPANIQTKPTRPKRAKAADFKVGDAVVVKAGVKDPDFDAKIGGWQGRSIDVYEDDPPMLHIEWDSLTLKGQDGAYFERCVAENLDWASMYLYADDLERAEPRDTEEDVEQTVEQIAGQYGRVNLDEQDRRIQQVLAGVDEDNELVDVWEEYLEKNLAFPVEAVIDESQERGPLKTGDRVKVTEITDVDEMYGIIVHLRVGRKSYHFPLCDLKVVDESSPNFQRVDDYRVWFANR